MPEQYKARVDVRRFLNYPGFHDGAYIVAYVEDTRRRRIAAPRNPRAFNADPIPHARTILEIADCGGRINLDFSLHRELHVQNSLQQGRLPPRSPHPVPAGPRRGSNPLRPAQALTRQRNEAEAEGAPPEVRTLTATRGSLHERVC